MVSSLKHPFLFSMPGLGKEFHWGLRCHVSELFAAVFYSAFDYFLWRNLCLKEEYGVVDRYKQWFQMLNRSMGELPFIFFTVIVFSYIFSRSWSFSPQRDNWWERWELANLFGLIITHCMHTLNNIDIPELCIISIYKFKNKRDENLIEKNVFTSLI